MSVVFLLFGWILTFGNSFIGIAPKRVVQISLLPPEKIESSVDFVVGWDIMLSRGIGRWAKQEGYDRTFREKNFNPLSQFSCYQDGECLLYFNLESMFSEKDNDQPKAGFLFRAHTGNIQTLLDLKEGNQLLLSLANNHTNNAWGVGVDLTRSRLSQHAIDFFGAGTTTWEAQTIFQTKKNWIHLCFQAFSYDGTSGKYGEKTLAWNPLHLPLMIWTLQKMQELGCEVKVLGLHWGAEYRIQPNARQKKLAHQLVDAGADIILWGHSHIPWAYEIYQWKPVFYSFGNFVFDQDWGKRATWREFDYIYDYELKRKTVPTYLPLLAYIKITKIWSTLNISTPEFKMARLDKGKFSPLDDQTFSWIVNSLLLE